MAALMASMPNIIFKNINLSNAQTNTSSGSRSSMPSIATFKNLKALAKRKSIAFLMGTNEEDQQVEESESGFVRYRPETLKELCRQTKFSKKEIQLMYRGFKQGCPTGLVTLEEFKGIYSQFFPQGDSSKYASFIFSTFDRDKSGQISFDEFVVGLSILSRGSEDEKLRWVFDLYDIDRDGLLTREDIETVIISIYDMMGPNTEPPVVEDTIKDHVDIIFSKMDDNGDGSITLPEFLDGCKNDQNILQSLHLFDTIFSSVPGGGVSSILY